LLIEEDKEAFGIAAEVSATNLTEQYLEKWPNRRATLVSLVTEMGLAAEVAVFALLSSEARGGGKEAALEFLFGVDPESGLA